MKKLFLFSVLLFLLSSAHSQKSNNTLKSSLFDETLIGTTWYDLQSNSALSNRIYYFPDGTISAVWTMGFQPTAFTDRGTGYNYFDGVSWDDPPTERIESERCGWPSIAAWGANGEIVVSFIPQMDTYGLLFNKRINKGQGVWEEFTWQGPPPDNEFVLWPRLTTSGDNNENIHLLCVTDPMHPYMGQDLALLYNRSTDSGLTWDIQWEILEGTGIDYYLGFWADQYIWAEPRDSVIAFAVVDLWKDMFIMKSTDHGLNWEKIMVWEHPYPFFNSNFTIMTDTLWVPDKSADIAIDNEGKVHLVCGLTRVCHIEPGYSYDFWPLTDGIAYWNEDMPPFEAPNQHDALDAEDVLIEDYNLVGWSQDIDGNGIIDLLDEVMTYPSLGLSTMPSLSIDDDNNIFLAYSATTEGYDNQLYNLKHIWLRGYSSGAQAWGEFLDIDSSLIHIFDECIYPVIAGSSDDQIHLIYNIDDAPGIALHDDHDYQENRITYVAVDKSSIFPSISKVEDNSFLLSGKFKAYPNPTQGNLFIETNLSDASNTKLIVYNSLGKVVEVIDISEEDSTTSINLAKYGNGIYYLKLESDAGSYVEKVCVAK